MQASEQGQKRLRGWDDETGEVRRQREQESDWRGLCRALGEGGLGDGTPEKEVGVVQVEGRQHAVEVHYLEEPACDYVETAVGTVLAIHEKQPEGDILLFLTGREEIEAACAAIKERLLQARERAEKPHQKTRPLSVMPLHASLPKELQLRALLPAARGTRKVVVSTNLAEASVTIENIVYVVDSCLVKLSAFCPCNGVTYLNVMPCAQSSVRQRAGRSGRTRPGKCYRLLTEVAFASSSSSLLSKHTVPEIARADLKDVVLLLKCLGVDDVGNFEFVASPTSESVELALEGLYALGALDSEACVREPLGPRLAHGPLPLHLMRFLLLAVEPPYECATEAAVICAMLTLREPWVHARPSKERTVACRQSFAVYEGDLVTLLNVFRQYETYQSTDVAWAERHLVSSAIIERAARVKRQMEDYLKLLGLPLASCEHEVERLQRLACAAFFLNAARRLPNGTYRLCRPIDEERAPHSRFHLHPASVLAGVESYAPADFVVFVEAVSVAERACLTQCTRIQMDWLPELAPHYFKPVAVGASAPDV